MIIRRFLYTQCKDQIFTALSIYILVTILLMLLFQHDNILLMSFYIATMYVFALLSDEMIQYRYTLAAAPISQRSLVYDAFLAIAIAGIFITALYSIMAALFSASYIIAYFALLLLLQLTLVLFVPNMPYVICSFVIVYALSMIDLEQFTLSLQFVCLYSAPFILSFFLLNRTTKWRVSA